MGARGRVARGWNGRRERAPDTLPALLALALLALAPFLLDDGPTARAFAARAPAAVLASFRLNLPHSAQGRADGGPARPVNACPCTLWHPSFAPTGPDTGADPAELGVKFRVDVAGEVDGVRFYKRAANTGAHVASLWRGDGVRLASADFAYESAAGWQQASFARPVPVQPGITYVASYHTAGPYVETGSYFSSGAVRSGPLRALADGEDGPNGVFALGPSGVFPTTAADGGNFWVDAVFSTAAPDVAPPRVVDLAPASGATEVSPSAALAVTLDEAVRPESLTFALAGADGAPVPAALGYDPTVRRAMLRPLAQLARESVFTATFGVTDWAGNRTALVWSFTTAPRAAATIAAIEPETPRVSATFASVGVELPYSGDGNRNATASLQFRPVGETAWRDGLPLWQTAGAAATGRAFYGSALFLTPGTTYDLRLTVADPDGVIGPSELTAQVATRRDDLPPAASLAATRHVRVGGSDQADGLSPATAWATLGHALATAPPGAVVQVGPGYFPVGAGLSRDAPLTLVAEHPAVDDGRNAINPDQRSVIESGVVSGPPSAPEAGVVRAPWQPVTLNGPGLAGAPASASYTVWRWTGLTAVPGWLGHADTRAARPTRIALWALKGGDLQTPAGWAEKLYTNRTYNYGWAAFANGAGRWDVYARLPGDVDPNTRYVTAGGAVGLRIAGPDVRISGFELRPFAAGVALGAAATRAVVDHDLIVVGAAGVSLEGDKDAAPDRYGSDHLIERNLIVDSSLWTADHVGAPAVPWGFIKGGIYNPDGTIYGSDRLGEGNETTGVLSRGGAQRVVVRRNTIDGPFNGVGAYNSGFDRYASQDQDVHDNLIRHISDDAFEPEQVAINWRIWRNRVEQTATVLSTGPVAYGPVYLVRNEAWRTGKDGVGRDDSGNPAVGATFFKYSGASDPQARVFVLHNTLWTDSTFAAPVDPQQGVDGSGQYAGGGGRGEQFYMRNNVVRATRYAFQAPAWDEDANSFSTSATTRGLSAFDRGWGTDVAGYRAAYAAAVGRPTGTNVGWSASTGAGSFAGASDVDGWLSAPSVGDLRLAAGSPFVDAGVPVPNVSDRPGVDYTGAAPDLGATER